MNDRSAWLRERRGGVGASDAPSVLGVDGAFDTALGVYLTKTGQRPELAETPEMAWGTRLEPVIAAAYEEETGRLLREVGLVRHPERPWQLATPDRQCIHERRLVELKCVHVFAAHDWGEPGTDEVPLRVLVQCQQQMDVTGMPACDVAALVGGSDFRIYTVAYHAGLAARIAEIGATFWGMVEARTPPAPNWRHPRTGDLVATLYAPRGGSVVLDAAGDLALAEDYCAAAARAKAAERDKEEARGRLIERMATASRAEIRAPGLPQTVATISRKEVAVKAHAVEAYSYFSFNLRFKEQHP